VGQGVQITGLQFDHKMGEKECLKDGEEKKREMLVPCKINADS